MPLFWNLRHLGNGSSRLGSQLLRGVAVFVITVIVAEALYAWFLVHSVRSVVSAAKQLHTGVTSRAEVDLFAKRFRIFADSENGCQGDACDYEFIIRNPLLSIPKIAPHATFMVFLQTHHGVLDQIDMGMFRAESRWTLGDRVVRVFDGPYSVPAEPGYRVSGPEYDSLLLIWLQKGASPAERARAYAFTAKCIALPFGCERPCDLHAEAWKDAKEFTVAPNSFAEDRRGTFRLSACK